MTSYIFRCESCGEVKEIEMPSWEAEHWSSDCVFCGSRMVLIGAVS